MVLKQSAINVDKKTVRCDGLPFQFSYEKHRQAQAHPAVYLKINKDNKADCPYCGRIFFYKEKAEKLMN
jgi:uncharacterized Zn-finger protein